MAKGDGERRSCILTSVSDQGWTMVIGEHGTLRPNREKNVMIISNCIYVL